jgi:chromosome segregation ATPase
LGVALLATGCAKPPQQELDGAQAAMNEATQAEAATYAPDEYARAQESMNAVNAELEAQNAKFALIRSYNRTKELVATANQEAADAKAAAAAGKQQTMGDAQAAIDAAKASLAAAQTAMTELEACRRKPKGFSKDMEMMQATWDGYNAQVAELDAAYGREDYKGAQAQAESLKAQADTLLSDLQAAKEKIRC